MYISEQVKDLMKERRAEHERAFEEKNGKWAKLNEEGKEFYQDFIFDGDIKGRLQHQTGKIWKLIPSKEVTGSVFCDGDLKIFPQHAEIVNFEGENPSELEIDTYQMLGYEIITQSWHS